MRPLKFPGCLLEPAMRWAYSLPMSTVETIEQEIKSLPRDQVLKLQDWLAEFLDSQEELNPEFIASIERGKQDLIRGEVRTA
jgi:hypothetical protein